MAKEHERCGTHMVGPLLAARSIGNALASRAAAGPPPAGSGTALAGVAAVGVAGGGVRLDDPASRPSAVPGDGPARVRHAAGAATREPTEAEMEVARAALDAVLRLEEAA